MIVALHERKSREAARRTQAARKVADRLNAQAACHGGRFVLSGNAACGEMHYDSDILADFPQARKLAAIMSAERSCAEESLPCDILPLEARSPEFVAPVRNDMVGLS